MTQANPTPDTIDLELDLRPLHPVPLVAECLSHIRVCQSAAALDSVIESLADVFDILTSEDCAVMTRAAEQKRAMLTPVTNSTTESTLPVAGETIGQIAATANAETIAARRAARCGASAASQSSTAIQAAITASRSAVSALLHEGKAFSVDPEKGNFGVVIAFGKRTAEVDPVTMRDRQALIVWSDLIAALSGAGLDSKLLGNAPSDRRHFGDAVGIVNQSGYVARSVKTPVGCEAQWIVGAINADSADTSLGQKELVLTLHTDGRVEASGTFQKPEFDLITSRAFASIHDFTTLTRALLMRGGVWAAMKAHLSPEEQSAIPSDVEMFHVEQLEVPELNEKRCLVWLRPHQPTVDTGE